jgi:hypothetical protein
VKTLIVIAVMLLCGVAGAQTAKLPDAPVPHRFLDTRNEITFTSYAAAVVMDSVSTQRFTAVGIKELNPIARPFVGSRRGQAFISALGYGTVVSTCYLAHRRGWHRVERWIPVAVGAIESYLTINNYKLVRRVTAPARLLLPDGLLTYAAVLGGVTFLITFVITSRLPMNSVLSKTGYGTWFNIGRPMGVGRKQSYERSCDDIYLMECSLVPDSSLAGSVAPLKLTCWC